VEQGKGYGDTDFTADDQEAVISSNNITVSFSLWNDLRRGFAFFCTEA